MNADDDSYLSRFLSAAFASSEEDPMELPVGATSFEEAPDPELLGRYPVAERIGRGGVGLVYRAYDPQLGREVAIKALRRELADDTRAVDRFLAEARLCSSLQHPGIVPIHELGRLDDGRPYFTMKIVEGETLAESMRHAAASRERLQVFGRVCETLAFVHAHDVVHADLKPQNIMVGRFGEVQLMDFGFARTLRGDGPGQREASPGDGTRVAGTPGYMAPEQARGDPATISERTDVFGLGAILLELLTGEPPFLGRTRSEILLRASRGWLDETKRRIDAEVSDPTLRELLRDCLAPDPADRPADAGAVARRVADHLASLEERVRRSEFEAAEARAEATQERRVRRLTVLLATVTVASILIPAGLFHHQSRKRDALRSAAEREVAEATSRVRALAGLARSDPFHGEARWGEALQAARLAETRAGGPDVGDRARSEATRLREEVESELASATERARIVRALARLHPHGDVEDGARIEAAYRDAFRELGLDPDDDPADVSAARVTASSAASELLEALRQWAWARRRSGRPDEDGWRRPLEVALLAEPDPTRRDVLRAFLADDLELLRRLAAAESSAAAGVLARCLAELGETDAAIEHYRRASFAGPADAWACHDLAAHLVLLPEPPHEEIVRLYSMAVALRPDDPHMSADLGGALMRQGRLEDAERVLRKAAGARPDHDRVGFALGLLLLRRGDMTNALDEFRRLSDRGYEVADRPTFDLLVRLGRHPEARSFLEEISARDVESLRRSDRLAFAARLLAAGALEPAERLARSIVAADPSPERVHLFLAQLNVERGRFEEADAELRRAVAAAGDDGAARVWVDRIRRTVDVARATLPRLAEAEARAEAEGAFESDSVAEVCRLASVALRAGRPRLAASLYRRLDGVPIAMVGGVEPLVMAVRAAARSALEDGGEPNAERREEWARRAFAWSTRAVEEAVAGAEAGLLPIGEAMTCVFTVGSQVALGRLRAEAGPSDAGDALDRALDRAARRLAERLSETR